MKDSPAIRFLVLIVGSLLLYTSGLFVVLTPLPFFSYWLQRRRFTVLVSFTVSVILIFFLYRYTLTHENQLTSFFALPGSAFLRLWGPGTVLAYALCYFSAYVAIGIVLSEAALRWEGLNKSMLCAGAAALVATLVFVLFLYKTHGNPIPDLRTYLLSLTDQVITLQAKNKAISGEEIQFMQKHKDFLVYQLIHLGPSFILISLGAVLWMNLIVIRRFFTSLAKWVDLASWKIDDRAVWGLIFLGVLYFSNLYTRSFSLVNDLVFNGLILYATAYFFQGLAILVFLIRQRPSFFLRATIYLLLFIFIQMAGFLVVFLGLADLWFDFRKLRTHSS
ncbi:MAG: DUF2232 domain-containing protein [Deltaproteobacteria bacterium]|nr:DUF2232 domain-containing protein [Deltaproteobacteria bacterium]